jgi:hypothetical protein
MLIAIAQELCDVGAAGETSLIGVRAHAHMIKEIARRGCPKRGYFSTISPPPRSSP